MEKPEIKENIGKALLDVAKLTFASFIDERSECHGRACTDMTERVRTSKGEALHLRRHIARTSTAVYTDIGGRCCFRNMLYGRYHVDFKKA
jgi:hypothetical protein